MSLDENRVDGVCEGELGQILGGIVFHLVGLEVGCVGPGRCVSNDSRLMSLTRVLQRLLSKDSSDRRFESDGRDDLVVNEVDLSDLSGRRSSWRGARQVTHGIKLDTAREDEVGYSTSVGKRRDVLSDAIEAHPQLVRDGAGELGLGLVTDDHDGVFHRGTILLDGRSRGL